MAEGCALRPLFAALGIPIPNLFDKSAVLAFALEIQAMSVEQFADWLAAERKESATILSIQELRVQSPPATAGDGIRELYKMAPIATLRHFASAAGRGLSLSNQEVSRLLKSQILSDPAAVLAVPWSWGAVLGDGNGESKTLRAQVCEASREALPYRRPAERILEHEPIAELATLVPAFDVIIESGEPSLLPYFTDAMFTAARTHHGAPHHSRRVAIPARLMAEIESSELFMIRRLYR